MRVVARVHHGASNSRAEPHVSGSSSLTYFDILVIDIADLSKRRHAIQVDAANFTRGHANLRIVFGFRHQLRTRAGRADELSTLVATKFDVVNLRTGWDVPQRQRISDSDW